MSMPASLSRPKRAAATATATAINASLKEQDKKIVEEPQDATPTSSKRKRGTKDQATLEMPTPGFEISAELDEAAMLAMTRQLKESMVPPDQSNFRVAAICTFRHEGKLRAIAGANSEAAKSFHQPRPISRLVCAGRPFRALLSTW